ncbi:MAG: cyclase family protein [Acidobacteriota bacterium]|nr:cyclase family protein [Acidobacteriota bacterium]
MKRIALSLLLAIPLMAQQHKTTKADVERLMKDLSNWGRWGTNDQIGTVNLITPAKRREAVALVKEGVSVSLARDAETEKAADNPAPFSHKFTYTGAKPLGQFVLDTYSVDYHGQAHTHMDALCHMFFEGKFYNGVPQSAVTDRGAKQLAVTNFKNGIMSRGILVDIPKLKGLDYLEPSAAIYPEDLDAWEKKSGVKISSGDVVFIRTGRWARRAAKGPWDAGAQAAGLHVSCARWFKDRDIAMIGSDLGTDVVPSQVEGVPQPIHQLFLVAMGTPIFDNCDLEALSKAAASRNRYAFLLTAAPLPVPGGTGSPLNPIATF